MHTPLESLRVIEIGSGVAASYAASLLAELGADVTKLIGEDPEPVSNADAIRRRARSIYLDSRKHRSPGGSREELQERAREADIIVRGADPYRGVRDAAMIREEYEACRSANPNLVYLALTPFGIEGSAAGWAGTDLQAQAMSGWTYLVGNPGEAPLAMNYDIGALQLGIAGAGAAVAALLERGRAGGEFVDVAEADVVAAAMRMYSMTYLFLGIPLRRQGLRAPGSSGRYPHTLLPCRDGYISTICRSAVDWDRFLEMMGRPAWADQPRYQDFYRMGTEYPDEVDALIVPWLMKHTKRELGDLAAKFKVPLAPVHTVDEVLADEQLSYRRFFRDVDDGDRTVRVPGLIAN